MSTFRYTACGVSIVASRAIPGLRPSDDDACTHPLHVTVQDTPAWLAGLTSRQARLFYTNPLPMTGGRPALEGWILDDDHFLLQRHDGTRAWLDSGGFRVWLDWPAEAAEEDANEFFRSVILGFVLRRRGVLCLHAAVVSTAGCAIALAGPPRVGKSALAVALVARGHRFVTDDVAAIAWMKDGQARVEPGPCWMQPRRTEGHGASWNDVDRVDVESIGPHCGPGAATLRALCFLDVDAARAAAPEWSPVAPARALIDLLSDTWAARLQDRAMRAQEFADAGRLVAGLAIARVQYAPQRDWAAHVADLVERQMTSFG